MEKNSINSENSILQIINGKESPIYWQKLISLNNIDRKLIAEKFGINILNYFLNLLKKQNNEICIHYKTKEDKESLQKKNLGIKVIKDNKGSMVLPPDGSNNFRCIGVIKEVYKDNILIEDKTKMSENFKCNKCGKEYWGSFSNESDFLGKKEPIQEGSNCFNTVNCTGKLLKQNAYKVKTFITENIINITDLNNFPIDFSKFVKNKTLGSTNMMISINKLSEKEIKRIKKFWNKNIEDVYDYWEELYGQGKDSEDSEVREDFCKNLVKNN